jgi:hypothetical protein
VLYASWPSTNMAISKISSALERVLENDFDDAFFVDFPTSNLADLLVQ